MGKPNPEQLARINQLARTPLTEDQVYVFTSKMIGDNMIPERFQRVTPNFLQKMSSQAKSGIALLLDHSWASFGGPLTIPIGRSFDARLNQEPDGELALYGDFYILRGQNVNGVHMDDIIAGIDGGTIFDTSVGFNIAKGICSIDGLNYYGGQCMHWKGQVYDGVVCTVDIDDGDLMENSLVFDGAYPGAGVVAASKNGDTTLKLVLQEDDGTLKQASHILCSFSHKTGLRTFVPETLSQPQGVDHVNELEQTKSQLSATRALLASVHTLLGVYADEEIQGAITALKANAALGETYKSKVIDEACGAGVRALGEAFSVDAMKLAFSNLPVSEVEKIRDMYEVQAKTALGGGGQHVVTQSHELPNGAPTNPQAAGNEPETQEEKFAKAREEAEAVLRRQGKLKEAR